MKREKIVVAMSGGVDSSVAAALLKEQGHEVIGVTLQIWQESATETRGAGCCSLGAVEDARRVAARIGIPHYVLNYREAFAEKVIRPFIDSYGRGETPNPCVNCNRHIKFDALLRQARALGADALATGHYARVFFDPAAGRWVLARAKDPAKDQTYAMYASTQEQLAFMRMPLGELDSKQETRALARRYGLPVADKPDSQEICFVQNNDYTAFLAEAAPGTVAAGNIVDSAGRVRGRHNGIASFTVGQRKRIRVGSSTPLYVLGIDAASRSVVVGADHELYASECYVDDLNWVSIGQPRPFPDATDAAPREPGGAGDPPLYCMAKIRYNMAPIPARIWPHGGPDAPPPAGGIAKAFVRFDTAVRAVAPGQAAVFYGTGAAADRVLGGGTVVAPHDAAGAPGAADQGRRTGE